MPTRTHQPVRDVGDGVRHVRRRALATALALLTALLAPSARAAAQQAPAPRPAAPARPAAPTAGAPARAAQTVTPEPIDSSQALPFDEFYRQVLAAHPVARQAALVRQQAREEQRVARGAFDPTVSATLDQKTFAGTQYYRYVEGELKVPTPFGSDLKLGYERALGRYIAADRRTGDPLNAALNQGVFKLGLSVPVGQRLVTDERRNALAQARALQDVAEADRQAAVNKLLLSAAKDYAAWYEAHRRRVVAREGVALAEFRLRAVRERVARGEAAAIDTVEALLEVQRRQVQKLEAEQVYYAASLGVTTYLWDDRSRPLDLADGVVPTVRGLEAERVDSTRLPAWLELAARRHPDVRKIAGRVDQAEAQRLFALQQVLPFAELSLNSVAGSDEFGALTSRSQFERSYVLGGTVRSPLLFMRERGRFNLADQRLEAQELEEARLKRVVELEVRQAVNDLATVHAILELQRLAVRQARALLRGEQQRFENGETQLLVVNIRERLVLEEELKLASLEAKWAGARASLAVAIGEPAMLPAGR